MSTLHTGESTSIGASDRPLERGDTVGEYTIRDLLGKGGFGTVYRAVHPLIGKVVAIKLLARRYSADEGMVQRFVDEARAVNQIRHRHIIDIFSFGQLPDGRHYYVMEYLDGTPLDQYLKANGPLELSEAMPILRAIARALDAAHAQGIAHRDLKPENIVLGFDDDNHPIPKLLDFGIAKLTTDDEQRAHRTGTGVPIGTPYYMSPEQCRGRDVDYRTDIYAFGVMCFRLLTGAYPFDGEIIDILHKHMHEVPPTPSVVNPALGGKVDAAIGAMLAKDPAQRPKTVLAAVAALTGDIAAPTPSRPSIRDAHANDVMMAPTIDASSAIPEPPVARTRRPVWLIVGGMAVAVGAVITFFVLVLGSDEHPARPTQPVGAVPLAVDAAPPLAADAPVAPPAPAQVIVEIHGVPAGIEVRNGASQIGFTPKVPVAFSTSRVVLTLVSPPGYVPAQIELVPDKDQSIAAKLEKKRRATTSRPQSKDDIFRADQLPKEAE